MNTSPIEMKKGGFVEAVTRAVAHNSDNWEVEYYMGNLDDGKRGRWDPRKAAVYMHTRSSALGPEWSELRRCVMAMDGTLTRFEQVRLGCV